MESNREDGMITHQEVNLLVNYTAREGIAVSFYLNTDGSERSKGMWTIEAKDLIKSARRELEGLTINRRYAEIADSSLRRIQNFISSESLTSKHKSVAIFSNAVENFYQIYFLPLAVKSNLILDSNFYLRPLLALLEEHCRIGFVLIDSRHARLFEVYMGEIVEHHDFATKSKVQRKPLLETFMKREKRLMQRKEEETRFHLSSTAETLRTHSRIRHFDKIVIGARKPLGDHLARLLTRTLQDNIIAVVEAEIHEKENDILSKAVQAENQYELGEERKLVRKIAIEVEKDGYAVKGVRNVIAAAHDYSLQTLAVAQDFSQAGMVCPQCGMPHLEEKTCVCCGESLVEVADVVYEIVEEAVRQGATVRHVRSEELIASLENVAAIIKFKKGELVHIEEAAETEA
jgi:peptide chain release factor subunit 1